MRRTQLLWNCPKCQRNRTTNFCQDCGSQKPANATIADKSLGELRLLVAHCRKVTQGKWNAHRTQLARGYDGSRELLSYEKHKRLLSAAEWALSVISECDTQSKEIES